MQWVSPALSITKLVITHKYTFHASPIYSCVSSMHSDMFGKGNILMHWPSITSGTQDPLAEIRVISVYGSDWVSIDISSRYAFPDWLAGYLISVCLSWFADCPFSLGMPSPIRWLDIFSRYAFSDWADAWRQNLLVHCSSRMSTHLMTDEFFSSPWGRYWKNACCPTPAVIQIVWKNTHSCTQSK